MKKNKFLRRRERAVFSTLLIRQVSSCKEIIVLRSLLSYLFKWLKNVTVLKDGSVSPAANKRNLPKAFYAFLICTAAFFSCSTFETWFPAKEGWTSKADIVRGTIAAGNISVDSMSLWESLEREVAGILPLLLLEHGYGYVKDLDDKKSPAAYSVDVSLIEREYMEGWQAKRSLSVEVRIWSVENPAIRTVPLAAGRAMMLGGQSFASSKISAKLLRLALTQALSSLERTEK